jgi:hypothetical protein
VEERFPDKEERMVVRYFALVAGVVYGLIGIAGFFPGMIQPPAPGDPALVVSHGYGYLFGLFPVNTLHNLVHLGLGLWGVAAYASFPASRFFARSLAVIYGLLAVMGLFPVLRTTFGLIPLFSHDIWLHAVTAVIAAFFGWGVRVPLAGRRPA